MFPLGTCAASVTVAVFGCSAQSGEMSGNSGAVKSRDGTPVNVAQSEECSNLMLLVRP